MFWTPTEIAYVVEAFFTSQSSIVATQRKFQQHFGKRQAPSQKVILHAVTNFREAGNANKKKSPGRPRTSRSAENCRRVANTIEQSPMMSTCRLPQQVNVPRTSAHGILKEDLHLYPYKVQLVQQLLPPDKVQRKTFSDWFVNMCRLEEELMQYLITSDEAHFHLSGYVNKQNCKFWGKANSQTVHERPSHSVKVAVWCAVTHACVIGPYFFEDEHGAAVTVTAERYNHMLNTFFIPELQRLGLTHMWMQQDGATSHTARLTMTTLREQFPGHLI